MKCPNCQTGRMEFSELDRDLPTRCCNECDGHWVDAESYHNWLKRHGETLPERDVCGEQTVVTEEQQALLCPDCGVIMLKWQVGHGLSFRIDRCSRCGGLWFERDEWQALKEKNLHDEIHRVFSASWQSDERRSQMRNRLETVYRERFAEDYDRVETFRQWLQQQEQVEQILAYIQESDPCDLQIRVTHGDGVDERLVIPPHES